MPCFDCGHRVIGHGCTRKGLDNIKRVTDHDNCSYWLPEDHPDTVIGKEIAHTKRFDKEEIEQYRQAGYILDIEKVSA